MWAIMEEQGTEMIGRSTKVFPLPMLGVEKADVSENDAHVIVASYVEELIMT